MPIAKAERVRNVLLIGAPGSGKTNLINQNFTSLGKIIVHDFKGDFLEHFYNPDKDFILNPFDKRCVAWNFFNEIKTEMDILEISKSLIPNTENPYWGNAARDIFTAIVRICILEKKMTNAAIWEMLQLRADALLEKFELHGERIALNHISNSTSGQTQGVLSTLAEGTKIFMHLAKVNGNFGLRNWLNRNDNSVLFIENMAIAEETLKPLITLFFDFAAKEVLSWSDIKDEVKINFILDEFPILHRMNALPRLLTNGRSKGASVWLGAQELKSIYARYGEDGTSLINACSNRFFFKVNDGETAKMLSEDVGEVQLKKRTETQVFGESSTDISLSFHEYEANENAILPSEFKSLKTGEVYFKLHEVQFFTKVQLAETNLLEKINLKFIPL